MYYYDLVPVYDRQRSFYGKAKVLIELEHKSLISYDTVVCRIDNDGTFVRIWQGYSATTMRHINEFRVQHGLTKLSKAEWMAL